MPSTTPSAPLDATSGGLTTAEVARRVAAGQVNRAPRSDLAEYGDIVRRNLLSVFNALVVPAALTLLFLGDLPAAFAVCGMAVANTLLGLIQEVRAKRHLDQLVILAQTTTRVRRDGREYTIPTADVVLGDHVLLTPGEPVVADGTVLEARFLEIDEALLTGESDPVPRRVGDRLLSGSFCVTGTGVYRADQVGREAFALQTSAQARRYHYTASPLQRTLDRLLEVLTLTAVVLCGLYVVLYFTWGFGAEDDRVVLARMAAATLTSMIPQGLVLTATLAFTLGAVRMAMRGAIVQRLPAVESMASVDVLCLDKTGTLTTGRLRLDRVGVGDASEPEAREWLRWFAWLSADESNKTIQALREALGALPTDAEVRLLEQIPFKSQNRYSAVRFRVGAVEQALALGAFEALKPFLVDESTARWEAAWRDLLPSGLRLLLLTRADGEGELPAFSDSLRGFLWRPVCLVALSDELRPEAPGVLEKLAAQGMRFKILSGDNAETVRATLGLLALPLAREPVVTGDELAAATDPLEVLHRCSVFGRVSPQQKLTIVAELQAQGSRVAMIGDGVNDILPIKRADLGIAMGEGSSATRAVAGLVLANNNFELLPATLAEGRTIVGNVRRAAKLFLMKNVYTLFLIVAALGVFALPFPYLPQQVTLLNFLTIGIPAVLIMMSRDAPGGSILNGFLPEVGTFAGIAGLVMGAAGLTVWLASAWWLGQDDTTQRTLLLSTLVLLGLGNVWRLAASDRTAPLPGQPGGTDAWLRAWVGLALLLYLAVVYTPPTATFFVLTPLTLTDWGLVLLVTGPALILLLALTPGPPPIGLRRSQ